MHFKTATSIAVLACAASAFARPDEARPYRPSERAAMLRSMPNLSLLRRDTNGYQPEQSQCHDGDTCEDACGSGYTSCSSNDSLSHCYNPAAGQQCCADGSGNSCDAKYYCTHDHNLKTWCCPDDMDLDECAKAFHVDGALESTVPQLTKAAAAASQTTEAAHSSSSTQAPTSAASSTSAPASHSSAVSSDSASRTTAAAVAQQTTSAAVVEQQTSAAAQPTSPEVAVPIWTGANSTVVGQPTGGKFPAPVASGGIVPGQPTTVSSAAKSGLSVLFLVAAGVVALL